MAGNYHDGPHSFEFAVSRDGLRLLLTLFDLEGAVYVSIWRDGLPDPLFTIVREACTHAQLLVHSNFENYTTSGQNVLGVLRAWW